MRALLALMVGLMLGSGTAAGFECVGVTLPSSIVICSDSELIKLADERQAAINEARVRIGEDRWPELWENQKAWVRSYATKCGVPPDRPRQIPVSISVKECFKQAAQARIAFIRAYGRTEGASTSSADTTPAAHSLKLSGDQRWVVLASRRDADEAIGIARYYSGDFPSVRVVKAGSGFYAIILGPEHTTNIQAFRERTKNLRSIPDDAFLSRGDSWAEEIWRMQSPILAEVNYDGRNPAKLNYDAISLSISRAPDSTAGGVDSSRCCRAASTTK